MDADQENGLAMSLWSSTALMVWEITITFDQEVELVWRGKWTFPKTLYVVARYVGLATSIMSSISSSHDHINRLCDVYNVVFQVLYCTISAASDGLLTLRVCAMYGSGPSLLHPILSTRTIVVLLYVILMLIFVAITIWNIQAAVGFEPDVENFGCFMITGLPTWAATFVVLATLVYDTILFLLTVIKILSIWKRGYSGALTNLLLRDGILYFAQIFATSLVCAVFIEAASPSVQSAALPWYSVVTPISAGRLFLNLKSMGTAKQALSVDHTTTEWDQPRRRMPSTTITSIHFAVEEPSDESQQA